MKKKGVERFMLHPFLFVYIIQKLLFTGLILVFFEAIKNILNGNSNYIALLLFLILIGMPWLFLMNYFFMGNIRDVQKKMLSDIGNKDDPKAFWKYNNPNYNPWDYLWIGKRGIFIPFNKK